MNPKVFNNNSNQEYFYSIAVISQSAKKKINEQITNYGFIYCIYRYKR